MTQQHTINNRHVVVVGGSSGIGQAVAELASHAGARVTILGRKAKPAEGIAARQVDITETAQLAGVFAELGPIDHLVVTAGARIGSPALVDLQRDVLQLAFDTKLFAALFVIQAALPQLAERGSITLTSGLLSRKVSPGSLLKSTLNAAIEVMGKSLARELAPRRVNVVSPGVTDTAAWGEAASEVRQSTLLRIGAGLPLGRVGQPEEVAQAYLLAMQNEFMTGSVIDIDGGGLL